MLSLDFALAEYFSWTVTANADRETALCIDLWLFYTYWLICV